MIEEDMYKDIRRLHAVEGLSQRSIAAKLQISRNTVKKYINGNATPWDRPKKAERKCPVLTPKVRTFVQKIIDDDRSEPKQQHHTAFRIWERLKAELEFTGGQSTIRELVREIKGNTKEAFVPLAFDPGEACQVDWGTAVVIIGNQRQKANLLCFRLCHSSAPFVMAFPSQRGEAFQEGHVVALRFFGGVPKSLIYDNLKTAVKEGWGKNAIQQDGFGRIMAHYACEAKFCNPSSGNEKGLVENLVGWSRRNILVPIPKVDSWSELNVLLARRCQEYIKTHQVKRHEGTVLERYSLEVKCLTPLPLKDYEPVKQVEAKVSLYSTIVFETNLYSVPVRLVGKTVTIKANAFSLEVYYKTQLIASHSRVYAKDQTTYQLAHYIPILEKKPRSVSNAKPVKAANLPAVIWQYSKSLPNPDKSMVRLLRMIVDFGLDKVASAVAKAIAGKLYSIDVIASLLIADTTPAMTLTSDLGPKVDEVDLGKYDQIIVGGGCH